MNSKHYLLLIAVLFSLYSCTKDVADNGNPELKFYSEQYTPFNYTEEGMARGLSSELLQYICQQTNIDFEVEFTHWDSAYNRALTTDNAVLFTTALNNHRKDLFQWAGPIATLDWNFYAKAGSSLTLNDLNDARAVSSIGVIAEYAMEEYLSDTNFTNLVYCTDIHDALTRLLGGEIDLFASDIYSTTDALTLMGQPAYAVTRLMTIKTDLLYYAFNKAVDQPLIDAFQSAIDAAKDNGTLQALTQKYLQTSTYPGKIQFYTESYIPLTFANSYGQITGYGTDMVKEMMKRNQVYEPITLSAWSNGYQLALINPNFCLFTMDRTQQREDLFQWVGPIGTNTTYFYVKTGSGITITSLDDARALNAVGTIDSWFSAQYMLEQGFTNLVYESDPEVMTQRLMNGEVDAFVCSSVTFPDILQAAGYDYSMTTPTLELMSSDFYVAFSNNTPTTLVQQWQQSLEAMKSDGTYNAIHATWFPDK